MILAQALNKIGLATEIKVHDISSSTKQNVVDTIKREITYINNAFKIA